MENTTHADYYEAESFWKGDALQDPGNVRRIERTIEMVPADVRSLLDVGCGNGVFGHRLLKKRQEISLAGVDRSKAALQHVKFTSQIASIDNLPFEDGSFDAVSCLQVIEHLPNDVYRTSLNELARVAGKYILIGVPFDENLELETTQCPQCRSVFNINFHLRSYSAPDIELLFSNFGFKMIAREFPAAKMRKKYINEIVAFMRREKEISQGFLSPVCPVCSYTEGDKTMLNHQPVPAPPSDQKRVSRKGQIGKHAVRALSSVLPTEEVKGYWVIALYERI